MRSVGGSRRTMRHAPPTTTWPPFPHPACLDTLRWASAGRVHGAGGGGGPRIAGFEPTPHIGTGARKSAKPIKPTENLSEAWNVHTTHKTPVLV